MRVAVALLTLLVLPGCWRAAAQTQQLTAIASPSGAGAAQPFLSSTGGGVVMSWLEPVKGTDRVALKFARHNGRTWSAPRVIIERNNLFVNWADFPSVVADKNGALLAHWLQKSGPATFAYDVWMAVSKNAGKTWSEPFLLNRDGTKTEHGFASIAARAAGGFAATWLDGRKMKAGHHQGDGGDMTVRYATISAGGQIRDDVELDGRVCECCTTAMAMTASGPVVLYRDRSADEVRDISFVRVSSNGWTAPQPIHRDGWKINACPVNGPQVDAIATNVAAAWFTAAGERQRVLVAFSSDAGSTFSRPVVADDGMPAGRVDIVMLDDNTALVTWLEQTAGGAEIRARRVGRDGRLQASTKIADSTTARAAGFPRVTSLGRQVWFAWTDQTAGNKRIRVAFGAF
jgi:hypothetical protein